MFSFHTISQRKQLYWGVPTVSVGEEKKGQVRLFWHAKMSDVISRNDFLRGFREGGRWNFFLLPYIFALAFLVIVFFAVCLLLPALRAHVHVLLHGWAFAYSVSSACLCTHWHDGRLNAKMHIILRVNNSNIATQRFSLILPLFFFSLFRILPEW